MPPLFIFILVVILGAPSSLSTIPNAQQQRAVNKKKKAKSGRPTPQAIFEGIKLAAQREVRSNSPLIIAPEFNVKVVGSTQQLTIVKGDVGALGFGDDPYELPFKKQVLIEALRDSRSRTDIGDKKLEVSKTSVQSVASMVQSAGKPYLASAEKLVQKTVIEIESEADKDRLNETLRDYEKQIDEILYDKIYVAVEQVAERQGYNIIYGRGGDNIKKFSVIIITQPDGAKIFMMTDLVYRKQLILKIDRAQWPWIEIVQNPYPLLGRYRYLTIWPDGKRAEGTIDVASASPLRFLPN